MYTFYEEPGSGNCYKVRLLLAQLDIPYDRIHIDIRKQETRTEEFLQINPNGRVPVLRIDDQTVLPESNAILWYLATGTAFLPGERLQQARVLQWMCFEQYSHEPYIAVARFIRHFLGKDDDPRLPELTDKGHAALGVMEKHLQGYAFFAGDRYTIADIALYAYTHVADDGGFDLSGYPAVNTWLERVAKQPGYVEITE